MGEKTRESFERVRPLILSKDSLKELNKNDAKESYVKIIRRS